MSVVRSAVAVSLCACLAAAGCTKADEPQTGEAKAEAEAKAEPTKDEPGTEHTAEDPASPPPTSTTTKTTTPGALAAAVASMVEAEASYPIELDPLLDLLPADSKMMCVVRDVDDILAMVDATLVPMGPAIRSFAAMADKDTGGNADKVLSGYERAAVALRGANFDLDKGLALVELDGDAVVIYGASTPDALPTLLKELGAEGDDLPDDCAAIPSAPGYAACATKPETLTKYAPAKDAKGVRELMAKRLDPQDIEQANLLVWLPLDEGDEPMLMGMATAPGLVHTMIGLAEAPKELSEAIGSGESPALGLVAPGGGFYWLKVDPEMIAERTSEAPVPARAMLKTLTGEVMLGTVTDPKALVVLAGVTDPAPAAGLVTLAGMVSGEIPKTLPDGSSLEVKVDPIEVDGKTIQTLHATLTPTAEGAKLFSRMGLVPEAWLFAVGGYAGVAFGSDKSIVEKIARYEGGVIDPELAKTLPKSMAQSLVEQRAGMAVHVPIDGIQSPQVIESFESVAKDLPAGDLPPGVTPSQLMKLAQAVVSPVSAMSMWMPPPTEDRLTIHVAYTLLGDSRTKEGQAALLAMTEVAGGGDPAAVYGDLATRFGSSSRTAAYQARAGARSDGALVSTAILGVMAAIAVPAFVKYQQRAHEAAMAAEMARAEAEAEAAAAAAAAAAEMK